MGGNRAPLSVLFGLALAAGVYAPSVLAAHKTPITPDWYQSFLAYGRVYNEWLTPDIERTHQQPDSLTDNACSDLVTLTCAAGTYDDGTGAASTLTFEASRARHQANEIFERARLAGIEERWDELLSGAHPELFAKMRSAFGLSGGDGCSGKLDRLTLLCKQSMSAKLSELTHKMIDAHNQAFFGRKIDAPLAQSVTEAEALYREFAPLLEDSVFQAAQTRYVAALRDYVIPDQKALLDRIQEIILPEVKRLLIERVQESVKNPDLAFEMGRRILGVKFVRDLNCAGKDPFAGVLSPGAKYEIESHSLRLCGKMLWMNRSEFGIVYSLAHELAHTIDPCRVTVPLGVGWDKTDVTRIPNHGRNFQKAEKNYAMGGAFLRCLRKDSSVGAKLPLKAAINVDPMGLGRALFCGELDEANGWGTRDQTIEAVPDWLAFEVIPAYIQSKHPHLLKDPAKIRLGYSNVFRGMCRSDFKPQYAEGDVHPPLERRIEALLNTQPLVRTQMKCTPAHPRYAYCAAPVSKNFRKY